MTAYRSSPATLSVPPDATAVISLLEAAGYESWIVGGFVRDALIGLPSRDIDVATAAPWERARDLFELHGFRVVETGCAHGTITVVQGARSYEVTSFRIDGPSDDRRHPNSVTPAPSIEADLARRDFTVNALAYHPTRGICDPFGGIVDIERGIIRCVGEPELRFNEDALRMLRACRFAAQLGFTIDSDTLKAMLQNKRHLACVSAERVAHELSLLLCGSFATDALLATAEVIAVAVPEIVATRGFDQRTPYHLFDVFEHTARVVGGAPAEATIRWAALCHDLGKPATFFTDDDGIGHFYGHAVVSAQITAGIMHRLRMPRRFSEKVITLVRHHDDEIAATHRAVKRAIRLLGGSTELFRALCKLQKADSLAHAPEHQSGAAHAELIERILDEIIATQAAFSLKDLAINGADLMDAGIEEGPAVGAALAQALEAVIDECIPNERSALISFALERAQLSGAEHTESV